VIGGSKKSKKKNKKKKPKIKTRTKWGGRGIETLGGFPTRKEGEIYKKSAGGTKTRAMFWKEWQSPQRSQPVLVHTGGKEGV